GPSPTARPASGASACRSGPPVVWRLAAASVESWSASPSPAGPRAGPGHASSETAPQTAAGLPLRRPPLRQQPLQGTRLDRLDEVLVEAGFLRAAAVVLLAPPRHGDDEGAPAPGLLPDAAAGVVAVELRQADVEQHHVGAERLGQLQGLEAVVGRARVVA